MRETGGGTATDNFSPHIAISSPESAFLLVSTKNTESGHFQGRKSANQGLPARLRTLSGREGLQKWTFTTIAHKLELATVRVLGVDKKESGLWRRDHSHWVSCAYAVATHKK